ncbi:UDP-N-acetylmuramoyl-L-alanyl-D-glutamate--2,6-diaminopimelate ligase [Peribacillus deserti]|uniref:UDP-N-acetylmuramoyl-L-alanyl-D-glutamate--2, 6-diaminopimelate ligase n=1 Tax=Peribacillus deserti TaxID=673318 RepID=A0A2N5M2H4_9BACI|nr:UDP-N-acetylmuramoyl-L-alanyl-D-glutamate--2,6-diaminopimelate ligase [Peribacillus deserti]PLT28574.1 UDP-N-acetylmuramoyl-L-alanyl-D-glutamate--2,6-diaminopimelate ligase [Peribacillus deserti]
MKLAELKAAIAPSIIQDSVTEDLPISGLQIHSGSINPGDMFVAISGYSHDGHEYIQEAIERGAQAIVGEKPIQLDIPYIQVEDSRKALPKLACTFYNFPAEKHKIIGITGTNGKTTVSYMIKHILNYAGLSCSLFGTISYIINGEEFPPTNTTPDSLQLQELLAKSNDEYVIMEISSHALEQSRIDGLALDYGLFTNLAHDHLDYHQTMDNYFSAKQKLFDYLKPNGKAIVNSIDTWGSKLAAILEEKKVSVKKIAGEAGGDLGLARVSCEGGSFHVSIEGKSYPVFLSFPGLHNVYNAAMSILTCYEAGIPLETIIEALGCFIGVPGRFEIVEHPYGARFVVDYAHTEDAIEYMLTTVRSLGAEKVTHIFGFRGGRDQTKRDLMLQTSLEHSDQVYLTIDDLNGVPLETMLDELEKIKQRVDGSRVQIIPDRTAAIRKAWLQAERDEWILVTGKGPELYAEDFLLPVKSDLEALEYLRQEADDVVKPGAKLQGLVR